MTRDPDIADLRADVKDLRAELSDERVSRTELEGKVLNNSDKLRNYAKIIYMVLGGIIALIVAFFKKLAALLL